ncbi:hypothetical protein [Paenibacillus plantarum]|uniref:hypothetical protein n=1 Tax=Paenibacillus plantarum TaxID=2654975 RepID=UPI00149180CA|nr:hypothetical protein [Paenibacillus plantarum]
MRKLIALAVASALVVTVAGCGNKAATPTTSPAGSTGAAATDGKNPTIGVAV